MKVYDCFMFYNEFELLNFRLKYLKDHVDYFIIVEADRTFVGNKKNQNFNINAFDEEIKSKIRYEYISYPHDDDSIWNNIHTVITDANDKNNIMSWKREYWTRLQLHNQIQDAESDDIIMLSDADEIPNIKLFQNLNWVSDVLKTYSVITLDQDIFHYSINGYLLEKNGIRHSCPSFKITTKKFLDETQTVMPVLRGIPGVYIPDSGWHFSYFGGANKIKNKLKSFSHTETSKDYIVNSIDEHFKNHTPFIHSHIMLSDKYDKSKLPDLVFTDEFRDFFEGNIV